MQTEMVLLKKNGPIATITLNRPEKYNTLRPEVIDGLDDALRDANALGVKGAVIKRDGPFGDYSQAPQSEHPRKRSELQDV